MRPSYLFASLIGLVLLPLQHLQGDSIDGGVVQVRLPSQDVTLYYVERKGGMTVELKAESASVEGRKLYLGDGKVAIELVVHKTDGILLQGVEYRQGDQFKNGSTIKVRPGYKSAAALVPGDVYVTLPGVTFEVPEK
jgi:hypothetical protein